MDSAWKYEKIYDAVKVKKTEGYESPFSGEKGPRNLVVDLKKLQIQEELGMNLQYCFIFLMQSSTLCPDCV